jgi:hypothetical protein
MDFEAGQVPLDPNFFDGRFMVEIEAWNWAVYVGLSPEGVPVEYRFQGGLNYSRGIEIAGRVRAPSFNRGKLMRIWISPFGPETEFGADGLDRVGHFYKDRQDALKSDFQAEIHLPEAALSPAITCLSSVWRYLDIWIADCHGDEASIMAFSFSASIHPNLADWAGPELSAT